MALFLIRDRNSSNSYCSSTRGAPQKHLNHLGVQKNRIILGLRHRGHVVGYLGDGINDAPSLHTADVGISVDSAVDVAKDAADIILLRQDLSVLEVVCPVDGYGCSRWNSRVTSRDRCSLAASGLATIATISATMIGPAPLTGSNANTR
jgi:hypothetical protein